MRIKKYRAETMKEALIQIRNDLGEDAMILKTSKIPRKLFSMGNHGGVEVTAAIDDNASSIPSASLPNISVSKPKTGVYSRPRPTAAYPEFKRNVAAAKPSPVEKKVASNKVAPIAEGENPLTTDKFHLLELRDDVHEMKRLLASILATGETSAAGGFAGAWAVLYKRLHDSEIKEEIAKKLINDLKNTTKEPDKNINKKFIDVLSKSFPVTGGLKPSGGGPLVVALVGPTGAGKTTTIAKLAAHYSMSEKLQVSLITADTYRIAAVDQIRTFADIIDIGMQVVFSPDEVSSALESCENDDIVFVDTAGRSQKNRAHMEELGDFLSSLEPDEIHLVLSATTKDSDLAEIVKSYGKFGINRLLFTKLDETSHYGNVFNTVSESAIPASFFTFGQSVPDDIELAQSGRFVQKLLERSSI